MSAACASSSLALLQSSSLSSAAVRSQRCLATEPRTGHQPQATGASVMKVRYGPGLGDP